MAITAILMLGLLTGGTGTTLALSGSAAQVQYQREVQPTPQNQSQPRNQSSPEDDVLGATEGRGSGQVLGRTQSGGGPGAAVQGGQQVAAAKEELPFTGLAAVPLIVLGLGLIATGAMLYRSARRSPSEAS